MVRKVHIPIFGQGLGHAIRMGYVAEELMKRGIEITFSAWGDGLEYLRSKGFTALEAPSLDLGWKDGAFSIADTLRRLPANCVRFLAQVSHELRTMNSLRPDIMISDSRLSALFAARLLSIPAYLVINQLRLLLPPSVSQGKRTALEEFAGEFFGTLWSFSKEILIPDLPPPFTISESMLWNVRTAFDKSRYVGFALPRRVVSGEDLERVSAQLQLSDAKPKVFAHISGPQPTKGVIMASLLQSAKNLTSSYDIIISEGKPGGDPNPREVNGCWYYEWCPQKETVLALSDIVIIRGGHTSISQAILEGKPMMVVPIRNHSEQAMNTDKVVRLGVGMRLDEGELSEETLSVALRSLMEKEEYRKSCAYVMEVARKMDGISGVIKAVLA